MGAHPVFGMTTGRDRLASENVSPRVEMIGVGTNHVAWARRGADGVVSSKKLRESRGLEPGFMRRRVFLSENGDHSITPSSPKCARIVGVSVISNTLCILS